MRVSLLKCVVARMPLAMERLQAEGARRGERGNAPVAALHERGATENPAPATLRGRLVVR
jgi:hypothetical protein